LVEFAGLGGSADLGHTAHLSIVIANAGRKWGRDGSTADLYEGLNLCCESDAGLPRNMGIYDLGCIYAQL